MSMFKITYKKGFHVTFNNGYTVSVQFGPGNYCSNHDMEIGKSDEEAGKIGSHDAECAVIGPDGEFIEMEGWFDIVCGYMSPDEVLDLMNTVRRME